jgi:hypothetical protein
MIALSAHWLGHAHASHSLDRGAPIHLFLCAVGRRSGQGRSERGESQDRHLGALTLSWGGARAGDRLLHPLGSCGRERAGWVAQPTAVRRKPKPSEAEKARNPDHIDRDENRRTLSQLHPPEPLGEHNRSSPFRSRPTAKLAAWSIDGRLATKAWPGARPVYGAQPEVRGGP